MRDNIIKTIRIVLAFIAGEFALNVLTYFVQEILFNDIRWTTSSWFDLIVGGALTTLAAVIAGMVARIVSKFYFLIIPTIISILIVAETIWIIQTRLGDNPVWYAALAGLSLIIGIWLGYIFGFSFKRKII